MRVAELFAKGGALARALPDYQFRREQVEMATVVEQALLDGGRYVLEAETGIGKSFAYLAAVIESGEKALISTGSRTLQDQLFQKDIPLLAKILQRPVRATVLKGRANYLCRLAVEKNTTATLGVDDETDGEWRRVIEFAAASRDGDIANATDIPAHSPVWWKATSTRETCAVTACKHYDNCFLYQARARAREADITIVNHHLFLSDLQLKEDGVAEILPNQTVVIFDEAHLLPTLAPEMFGRQLSAATLVRLSNDLESYLGDNKKSNKDAKAEHSAPPAVAMARQLRGLTAVWQGAARGTRGGRVMADELLTREAWRRALLDIGAQLSNISDALRKTEEVRAQNFRKRMRDINKFITHWLGEQRPQADAAIGGEDAAAQVGCVDSASHGAGAAIGGEDAAARVGCVDEASDGAGGDYASADEDAAAVTVDRSMSEVGEGVTAEVDDDDDGNGNEAPVVKWADVSGGNIVLYSTPINGREPFARQWSRHPVCIFTSATLAVSGDFSAYRYAVGLDDARARGWGSPYDFAKQAMLYMPKLRAQPNDPDYADAVMAAALPLVRANGGRALLLFSSLSALRRGAEILRAELGGEAYEIFKQGEQPNETLLSKFRAAKRGVLLGSKSFWQGIDVRGHALSLVVVDKIPFVPPDEPLIRGLEAWRKSRGENVFVADQLPAAVVQMRQAAGRLIRDSRDYGVFMICDARMRTRGYGRLIARALPPMKRSDSEREATEFLRAWRSRS